MPEDRYDHLATRDDATETRRPHRAPTPSQATRTCNTVAPVNPYTRERSRATNGRLEGTNAKLGVLKRIGCGFVSATNFAHRALLLTPAVAS